MSRSNHQTECRRCRKQHFLQKVVKHEPRGQGLFLLDQAIFFSGQGYFLFGQGHFQFSSWARSFSSWARSLPSKKMTFPAIIMLATKPLQCKLCMKERFRAWGLRLRVYPNKGGCRGYKRLRDYDFKGD